MGILKLIAMIDLWYLSREFDRKDLSRAVSLCLKESIGDIGRDDAIGDQPFPVRKIEGAAVGIGIHAHLSGPDPINLPLRLDPDLWKLDRHLRDLDLFLTKIGIQAQRHPLRSENMGKNLGPVQDNFLETHLECRLKDACQISLI